MPLSILIGLIVFVVVTLVGLGAAAQQGLRAWRALKRFRRAMDGTTRELSAQLAALEARSAQLPERQARLEAARASLEESVAEARVLLRATSEVAALVQGVRNVLPSR